MRAFAFLLSSLLAGSALAQAPAAGNYVTNGDFTKSKPVDNLWDGVNSLGGLAGFTASAYAVTESGPAGGVAMPITVNWVDMNGDGLPDIATCDPSGVMRVYFNQGNKTAPKFTLAETVPIFLARPAKDEEWNNQWPHGYPKIALYDASKRGAPDLYVGNYSGEILFLRNAGGLSGPSFTQPPTYEKATLPTGKKGELWGNLFAPCVYDWNKDGKPDLLIGEGSYSANAIHLLLNEGTASDPRYTAEQRYYLCYGDGREHLVPTVADINGDGLPDVLVGNRGGTIAVHLGVPNWKPGMELTFSKLLDFGGSEKLGVAVAPCAGDVNGDGLVDLLIGRADGRVQVAINEGTPQEAKFGKPVDVPGVDLWPKNILRPDGWSMNAGEMKGNFFAYVSTIEEKSPSGGKVLRMSYWPPPNKLIKMVPHTVKGQDNTDFFRPGYAKWYQADANQGTEGKPTNCFCIRQPINTLQTGGTYTLKFKARGSKIDQGSATVAILGVAEIAPAKMMKKQRGVNIVRNEKKEEYEFEQNFTSANGWTPYSKTFTINFKEKEVRALSAPTFGTLEFKCYLAPFDGVCDICDVELVVSK